MHFHSRNILSLQEEGEQSTLTLDEVQVIQGALDMANKTAESAMTPIEKASQDVPTAAALAFECRVNLTNRTVQSAANETTDARHTSAAHNPGPSVLPLPVLRTQVFMISSDAEVNDELLFKIFVTI